MKKYILLVNLSILSLLSVEINNNFWLKLSPEKLDYFEELKKKNKDECRQKLVLATLKNFEDSNPNDAETMQVDALKDFLNIKDGTFSYDEKERENIFDRVSNSKDSIFKLENSNSQALKDLKISILASFSSFNTQDLAATVQDKLKKLKVKNDKECNEIGNLLFEINLDGSQSFKRMWRYGFFKVMFNGAILWKNIKNDY